MALFGFGKKTDLVGLDIGSSCIKAAALKEVRKGGGYKLTHFGVEHIPSEAIVDGSILDASIVIEAISKLFRDKGIKNKNVAINISGAAVIIKRISVPQMSAAELAEHIVFEAEQYLPFSVEDVHMDHVIEKTQQAEGGNMDVLLVAAKKDKVNDYVSVVSQAGLVPMVVDVDVFALQNCYEMNHQIGDGLSVLVNVGASVTNVNVMDGEHGVFWRDLNVGGKKYNEALQRDLGLNEEQAEQAKRGDPAAGVPPEQVIPILNGVSEDIAKEVSKTVDFARHAAVDKPPARIMLSGGAAQTENLNKILENALKAPVEAINPFAHVMVSPKEFDFEWLRPYMPAAPVVVGLASRRLGDY